MMHFYIYANFYYFYFIITTNYKHIHLYIHTCSITILVSLPSNSPIWKWNDIVLHTIQYIQNVFNDKSSFVFAIWFFIIDSNFHMIAT